jgi:hypothetical protein
MDSVSPLKRVGDKGWLDGQGYRRVYDGGRQRHEHRVVMERVLGRPLLPEELVHHRNRVKTDNRPENLELWVRCHPNGQRVADLVAWATEILARYAPERLAPM